MGEGIFLGRNGGVLGRSAISTYGYMAKHQMVALATSCMELLSVDLSAPELVPSIAEAKTEDVRIARQRNRQEIDKMQVEIGN